MQEVTEKINMTTKNGFEFSVSFSSEPPDYSRLAKFFLLLAEKSIVARNQTSILRL